MAFAIVNLIGDILEVAKSQYRAEEIINDLFHPSTRPLLKVEQFDQPLCGGRCQVCMDGTFLPLGGCEFLSIASEVYDAMHPTNEFGHNVCVGCGYTSCGGGRGCGHCSDCSGEHCECHLQ